MVHDSRGGTMDFQRRRRSQRAAGDSEKAGLRLSERGRAGISRQREQSGDEWESESLRRIDSCAPSRSLPPLHQAGQKMVAYGWPSPPQMQDLEKPLLLVLLVPLMTEPPQIEARWWWRLWPLPSAPSLCHQQCWRVDCCMKTHRRPCHSGHSQHLAFYLRAGC